MPRSLILATTCRAIAGVGSWKLKASQTWVCKSNFTFTVFPPADNCAYGGP